MPESKFTAARANAFLEAIRYGASVRTASAEAGVSHQTGLRWIEKGKSATVDSTFGKFYEAYLSATASPRMRALRSVWDGVPDDPKLAFKVLQTLEQGWAPPMPQTATMAAPVIVNLSLGGAPPPRWMDAEVVDAEESPAIGDGGDTATDAEPPGQSSAASP